MAIAKKETNMLKPTTINFVVGRINLITDIGFLEAEKEYEMPISEFNKIKNLVNENKIKVK